jgi:hypothetical protein
MARPNRIVDHLGTGDETGRLPFDRNGRSGLPGPTKARASVVNSSSVETRS